MPKFEPKCTLVSESSQYSKTWIRDLNYQNQTLVLQIANEEEFDLELRFPNLEGFRVLDELHLCEFWKDYHMKNGWLWEVTEGGWTQLEQMRGSFVAADMFKSRLREYLVTSLTTCVSVMTINAPEFRRLDE